MSLTTTDLVEDISDVTCQVWENILSIEAVPVPARDGAQLSVASSVQIIGVWNGAVMLSMPPELGTLIATTMFELAAEDLDPTELDDAVGEMANMIGGNIKSLLPGPSQLSMPTVVRGDHAPGFPGTVISEHLEFLVEGLPFTVTVFEGAPSPEASGAEHTQPTESGQHVETAQTPDSPRSES